ncbi:aldose 1-epimerase [Phenylobacterium sp. LjRoot225]|uniref:aldose 1-epimerase n=1 Tax=Phenylobacterium sp. LjRoot225 TaxID=3342285 RepID=UPI003ECCB61F
MTEPVVIGGAPVVSLEARDLPAEGPAFVSAEVAPGRGFLLLRARLRLASGEIVDGVQGPEPAEAARLLDGGPEDFAGNRAFSFGGAILAPYANRIRGRHVTGAREIETEIDGHSVRLPRNWGGKAPGAAQYAMHGLILDTPVICAQPSPDRLTGHLDAGDFGGRWPARTAMHLEWRLAGGRLELAVTVRNTGAEPLPFALGWHPYFALPSGRRDQARLRLAAAARVEVDDYDQVLPTGRLLETAGTPYDFGAADGRALGDLYLDDCFTGLVRRDGRVVVELIDPAAGMGFRISSPTAQVKAVQVYAPLDKAFAAIEPQFNLADPYSDIWPAGLDTGMARLAPGRSLTYEVRAEPFMVVEPK